MHGPRCFRKPPDAKIDGPFALIGPGAIFQAQSNTPFRVCCSAS
jgi:hypothetical protein